MLSTHINITYKEILTVKQDDHNLRELSSTPSESTNRDRSRNHRTLSSAIESFLELNNPNGSTTQSPQSLQETFNQALSLLASEEGSELALQLLDTINLEDAAGLGPDGKKKGVSDEFLDSLERVQLKDLPNKETADCPICTNLFIDNEYPLLVRLPCNVQHVSGKKAKGHIFDMECISPWLKMNSTCPLCRFDIVAAEKKRKENLEEELRKLKEEDDEEEEEGWDIYG